MTSWLSGSEGLLLDPPPYHWPALAHWLATTPNPCPATLIQCFFFPGNLERYLVSTVGTCYASTDASQPITIDGAPDSRPRARTLTNFYADDCERVATGVTELRTRQTSRRSSSVGRFATYRQPLRSAKGSKVDVIMSPTEETSRYAEIDTRKRRIAGRGPVCAEAASSAVDPCSV